MNCDDPECRAGGDHGEHWRCAGHSKYRDAQGKKVPCKARHVKGTRCCRMHGYTTLTKRTAKQKLLELADPAVGVLQKALDQADRKGLELHPGLVKVALAVLDRTGLPAGIKVEVEEHGSNRWLAFATAEEKRQILEIMDRCQRRADKGAA